MGQHDGQVVGQDPSSANDIVAAHPEVQFALVLARTIDSVSSDPELLRSAVYELARQKLQELAHGDHSEKKRLTNALEVAIAGVEAHTKNVKPVELPVPSTAGFLQVIAAPRIIETATSSPGEVAGSHKATYAPGSYRAARSSELTRSQWPAYV